MHNLFDSHVSPLSVILAALFGAAATLGAVSFVVSDSHRYMYGSVMLMLTATSISVQAAHYRTRRAFHSVRALDSWASGDDGKLKSVK